MFLSPAWTPEPKNSSWKRKSEQFHAFFASETQAASSLTRQLCQQAFTVYNAGQQFYFNWWTEIFDIFLHKAEFNQLIWSKKHSDSSNNASDYIAALFAQTKTSILNKRDKNLDKNVFVWTKSE